MVHQFPKIHLNLSWFKIKELIRGVASNALAAADSTDELLLHCSSSIYVHLALVSAPKGAEAGVDGLRVTDQPLRAFISRYQQN